MKNTNKAVLATILVGLGAGLAKLAQKHDGKDIKDTTNRITQRAKHNQISHRSEQAYRFNSAYARISKRQRNYVNGIYSAIMPKTNNLPKFMFQKHAIQYLRVLNYLRHRFEFDANDASTNLNIPLFRIKKIAIALSQQGILEHDIYGIDSIRDNRVRLSLRYLKKLVSKGGIVAPIIFSKALKNLIAYNLFDL